MPKREDINTIMVIGSGPIVIGQAAEFDYAGTQACLSLREEGYRVVLVNSNPATIMTDPEVADKVYIEPLTPEFLTQILYQERPDALLPTLGGQTALNLAVELAQRGVLADLGVELLGTDLKAIKKAEDRLEFKELMAEIGQPIPASATVNTVAEAVAVAAEIGYPVIVRPAFTLGGSGGGMCASEEELREITQLGLDASPVNECLIEQSIAGYKEIELEMMRDGADNTMVVCGMENFDPVGIHTGDSIVFAPCQTLTDRDFQMLRDAAIAIVRALGIRGGCNVQLALDPDSSQYYVIEVNPRVSRSSALASKATGYPIAKLAAKVAVGMTLDEIRNPITDTTWMMFEPALDYVVTKIPRWPFDKFAQADRTLGTQMKATGEVMALGRTLEESLLKAVRSLEIGRDGLEDNAVRALENEILWERVRHARDDRLWCLAELIRRGANLTEIHAATRIDLFFLDALEQLVQLEQTLAAAPGDREVLAAAKTAGIADTQIARAWQMRPLEVRELRKREGIVPGFLMVDTCAAEFASATPYFYSSYENLNESVPFSTPAVLVIGSGPIRIGQGVEFDYATVHSVKAIQAAGYRAIVMNSNPETVSTDFSISDKLYFEPLTLEDVLNVIDLEQPLGVIVQCGGQTAINLAGPLAQAGVPILGTQVRDLDAAEDRDQFETLLAQLAIAMPPGGMASTAAQAQEIAQRLGYPVLVRPSYVIGGRAMAVVHDDEELARYMLEAASVSADRPILVDKYLQGTECEVDAVCDGTEVFIPGIMEHIERAGIHSGDSMAIYPPQSISPQLQAEIVEITRKLALGLNTVGLINVQFVIANGIPYVIEANPRASRTVPFLSKVTGQNIAQLATRVILGETLAQLQVTPGLLPPPRDRIAIKAPVFSFQKLRLVDAALGPEMKSTGEVMGANGNLENALEKAFAASYCEVPAHGSVLFTVADAAKPQVLELAQAIAALGFRLYGTVGTASYLNTHGLHVIPVGRVGQEGSVLDLIASGKCDMVINVMAQSARTETDGQIIRMSATAHNIPLFTSLDTAAAIVRVMQLRALHVRAL